MWLKKIFKKQQKAQQANSSQGPPAFQEDAQVSQSKVYTVSQNEIDLRYAQLRIIKTKNLNLPHNEINLIQSAFFHQKECLQAKNRFADEWSNVQVIITDKQLIVIPDLFRPASNGVNDYDILHVHFGMIEKLQLVQLKKQPPKLYFTLKDNRGFVFQSVLGDKISQIDRLVREFGFPNGINKFYAFKYGKVSKKINGWQIYSFQKEMARMKVNNFLQNRERDQHISKKAVYQMIDNSSFELSPTYPEWLIIPAGITQKEYIKCSRFRTKQRLPILTYFMEYEPNSYVSLFRCSQNKGGLLTNRCPEDQKLIQLISNATEKISKNQIDSKGKINCKIYDARGYYAALGNKIAGKGFQNQQFYSCPIQFLNIPNIHAVRDSYNKVKSFNPYKEEFLSVLGQSGWIDYLYLILSGAKSMVKSMLNGQNVVVHCSDGWDRTSQLATLAQIILDPYYRTIEGFVVLFEKDWRGAGHKFRERSGQYNSKEYHPNQKSPIFIQYLDCVVQLINQFPLSFEFNLKFLNFLATAYQSCSFGTFLANNIKQGKVLEIEEKTISIWSDILQEKAIYKNCLYDSAGPKVLDISAESIDFTVWKQHFLQEKTLKTRQYQSFYQQFQINQELKQQLAKYQHKIKQLQQLQHLLKES